MHTQFSIYAPREPKVARLCRQCGTTFLIGAGVARQTPRHFCSPECRIAWFGDEQRFWEQLEIGPNDCWFWTGCLNQGYGYVHWQGRMWLTHRLAWTLKNGPIPPGLDACHTCDVYGLPGDIGYRRCSNPAHIFLGTKTENTKDMYAKGRGDPQGHKKGVAVQYVRGEQLHTSVLTEEAVRIIRATPLRRGTTSELARRFGVAPLTVADVLHGKTWKHVT